MTRTGAIHEVRRTLAGRRTRASARGREPVRAHARLTALSGIVFGVRAAGRCMTTTTTLTRRRALPPRPVVVVSHLGAAYLLLSTTLHPATLPVFPGWVPLLSVVLLVHAARPLRPTTAHRPIPDRRTSS